MEVTVFCRESRLATIFPFVFYLSSYLFSTCAAGGVVARPSESGVSTLITCRNYLTTWLAMSKIPLLKSTMVKGILRERKQLSMSSLGFPEKFDMMSI